MTTLELPSSVSIQEFELKYVSAISSPSSPTVDILYTAAGPSGAGDLLSWDYSLDNGTTWKQMTLEDESQTQNIVFSPTRAPNTLTWSGYDDLGMSLWNTNIMIRLSAGDGEHVSPYMLTNLLFNKTVTSPSSRTVAPINNSTHVGRKMQVFITSKRDV